MTRNRQEVYKGETRGGGRGDRGKKEKLASPVEAQISIENPVIPNTTFDLERQLRDYDPVISAVVDRINLLEVEMDALAIPASPAQHGHQIRESKQLQSKLSRLSATLASEDSVDEETSSVQILKEKLSELSSQVQAVNDQLQALPEQSQANLLRQLKQQMIEAEVRMKKMSILYYVLPEKIDQLAELKRLRSLIGNLGEHIRKQVGLETNVVLEDCQLLQDLVELLLSKVDSNRAVSEMQKAQDELRELERRAPLAKNALAKKNSASTIAEKHREIAELRASQAEIVKQNPDVITQRMAADMLALNMSYEAFGIPRGLEEWVTFPLSERVGIVEGADPSRSFIIISAYSRKPSGAQGYLLFERFVMDPSKFTETRQLFSAIANDPRNSNLVVRMIDYAPKTADSSDGLLAQGITELARESSAQLDLKPDTKKAKKRPQKNKKAQSNQGPGRYSGRRR